MSNFLLPPPPPPSPAFHETCACPPACRCMRVRGFFSLLVRVPGRDNEYLYVAEREKEMFTPCSTPHISDGFPPFSIFFGRKSVFPSVLVPIRDSGEQKKKLKIRFFFDILQHTKKEKKNELKLRNKNTKVNKVAI